MSARTELLEFSVLGLLHEGPMHGYELRRRLNSALGAFRALSYGTLYPCLRSLAARGLVTTESEPDASARARIPYAQTPAGRARVDDLAANADEHAYGDEAFDVRVAFFARTEAAVRLRILEGRRRTLVDRLARARESVGSDAWLATLARRDADGLERDIAWLGGLIDRETRSGGIERNPLTDPSHPAFTPAVPRRPRRTTPWKIPPHGGSAPVDPR
jgi:DNA-binding PadR family transcriptional regulator